MGVMTRGLTFLAVVAFAACGQKDAAPESGDSAAAAESAPVAAAATVDPTLPAVVVYKTATCGCCNGWVEHVRAAGFKVDARDVQDIMSVKTDAGVPKDLSSCHTALIDGYVVEGHVPADIIKRLLAERPDIVGLSAPGMPAGSPGMEGPGAKPYQIIAFDHDGGTRVYAEIDPR